MAESTHRLVVVALTQNEARIWARGIEPGQIPLKIFAADERGRHHHVREAQHHHGHDVDHPSADYFEAIAKEISEAGVILLIGHGEGKGSAMSSLSEYLAQKHPAISKSVAATIESNLPALSEPEILAMARDWFARNPL